MNCPGSVNLIAENELTDEAGEAADRGTILHDIMEQCLRGNVSPYGFVGRQFVYGKATVDFDEDLADTLQEGLDRIDEIPGKIYIEKQVTLDPWMPGQFGTCDLGFIQRKKRRVVIWDNKFGYIPVSPVENEQVMLYGLGLWNDYLRDEDIDEFVFIIWQPFAPGGGGEWSCSLKTLLKFAERAKKAAAETYEKDAALNPGQKQCAYCPAAENLVCARYIDWNLKNVVADFDELDEEGELDIPMRASLRTKLTPKRRSTIIKNIPTIKKFLDRLEAAAAEDYMKDRPTPGLKVVKGRNPARRWADPEAAKQELDLMLDAKAYAPAKLLSPTQIQKVVSEKTYARIHRRLVDEGEPKSILVAENDPRPGVPTLKHEFDEDDDD